MTEVGSTLKEEWSLKNINEIYPNAFRVECNWTCVGQLSHATKKVLKSATLIKQMSLFDTA